MNHQQPLRVNRYRKHIAAISWGFAYDPAGPTVLWYMKRNGLITWTHTTPMWPIGEGPADEALHQFGLLKIGDGKCTSANNFVEPSDSPKTEAS